MSGKSKSVKGTLGTLAILALAFVAHRAGWIDLSSESGGASALQDRAGADSSRATNARRSADGDAGTSVGKSDGTGAGARLIAKSFAEERSDVIVEAAGVVDRVLPDDNEGSRHQRFIVDLGNGLTVLIAHNIDLAPRVPLDRGDRVEFKGEYEWSERGGVVHWTHHDPRGSHPGGWIRVDGKTYE